MIKYLLLQQFKETTRSPLFQKKVGANIAISLLILYFAVNLMALGFFIDILIIKKFPYESPILVFNGFIIYYLMIDLLMRFMLQSSPVLSIEPYLHLPIKKSKIINFLLSKSVFSFFNILPFLIFVPFAIKAISLQYSTFAVMIWLASILFVIMGNSLATFYLKKQIVDNPRIVMIFGLVLGIVSLLDYYNVILLTSYSSAIFQSILGHNYLIVLPAIFVGALYYLNYRFLHNNTYLQEISTKKQGKPLTKVNLPILEKMEEVGQLIALELRLIWRNKRPRSAVLLSLIILIYGPIFYPQKVYIESFGILIFVGIMLTGMPIVQYGGLLFSWNSGFFDSLLTNNISIEKYMKSKFYLLITFSFIIFILTTPFVYFGIEILYINLATFLFNIGTTSYLMIIVGMSKPKRIDLSRKASFNYEGVSAANFLVFIPLLLIPQAIMAPFYIFGNEYTGLAILAAIGLAGLLSNTFWLKLLAKKMLYRKYEIADGFRIS